MRGVVGDDWPFDDPARATGAEEEILAVFRRVREQIRRRVETFLEEVEKEAIVKALEATRYNKTAAAKKLGIPTLFYVAPQLWAWAP